MVYPQHARLVWSGTAWSGQEIWSCSLRLIGYGGASPANLPVLTDSFAAIIRDSWHTASNARISSRALLDSVKLNLIGPDNRYVSASNTNEFIFDTPVAGGATNEVFPPQCARVITLRSDLRRGPAALGRFFSPCPTGSVDALGLEPVATQTAVRDQAVTFIDALNDAGLGWRVSNVSGVGAGSSRLVGEVGVGRVVDTQRRRSNALEEEFLYGAVADGGFGGGGDLSD